MSPTRKIARDFSENQSAMCHRHCTSRTYVLAQKSAVKPPMALQSQETLSVPLCLALVTYRTFALTMTNNGGSLTQIMNNNSCYIFGQKIRRELSNSRIFPFGFLFFLSFFLFFSFFFLFNTEEEMPSWVHLPLLLWLDRGFHTHCGWFSMTIIRFQKVSNCGDSLQPFLQDTI